MDWELIRASLERHDAKTWNILKVAQIKRHHLEAKLQRSCAYDQVFKTQIVPQRRLLTLNPAC